MKRISISAIVLLIITVGITDARPTRGHHGFRYGYSSNQYRTRWSVYAHGLVSGNLYYSPYAVGHGRTGLVENHVRYSPYAFGGGHSGLIEDYGSSYGYGHSPVFFHLVHSYGPVNQSCKSSNASYNYGQSTQLYAQKQLRETVEERKNRRAALAKARKEKNAIRENDGKQIIAGYLKGKNLPFRITRGLNIKGKTVSVDFLFDDGKTIIKYWNLKDIPSQEKLQQRERKFFDNYVESWKLVRDEHLKSGGNIYQIISSDREEILAMLPQCLDLNENSKIYASAKNEPAPAEMQ